MTKLTNFQKVALISVGIILFLAFMDTLGFAMWQTVGGFGGEVYTKAEASYLHFFWFFAFALISTVALVYYIFRRDRSETLALIAIPTLLVLGGLEDILYYILRGLPLDASMPWLYNSIGIGSVAKALGETTVTPSTLIISVIVFSTITYMLYKYLEKAKW